MSRRQHGNAGKRIVKQDAKSGAGTTAPIEILPVTDKAGKDAFIKVPFALYRDDPLWVPPLLIERHEHLDEKKNPYFEHAETAMWIARRGNQDVGRISAQICRLHNERYQDSSGQFGFLEAVDDAEVFSALLSTAEAWLIERGVKVIRGPFSFSINDELGLLCDGFDTPPFFMMPHTPRYYLSRVEAQGYDKAKDLIAYEYLPSTELPNNMDAIIKRALQSGDLVIRSLRRADLENELKLILDIFNDAWSDNWGFVPMTSKELTALGANLKMLVKDEYIAIAEIKGEPAAMAVTLPNINDWIKDLNGRLLPFNWAKLIWRLKTEHPRGIRLPLMGVRKKFQTGMTGAAASLGVIDAIRRYHEGKGTVRGELSWILEDNLPMRKMIETIGGNPYKTYRIYEKEL